MKLSIAWLFARLALLALGVYGFAGLVQQNTNFNVVGGLICGPLLFLFVLVMVMKNSDRKEEMYSLTSPFWPPWKYPQTHWFTTGLLIFVSAAVNLAFHLLDPSARELYAGLTLVGAGVLGGGIVGRYRFSKTQ